MTISHDLAISSHKAVLILDRLKRDKYEVHLQERVGGVHLDIDPPQALKESAARERVRGVITAVIVT